VLHFVGVDLKWSTSVAKYRQPTKSCAVIITYTWNIRPPVKGLFQLSSGAFNTRLLCPIFSTLCLQTFPSASFLHHKASWHSLIGHIHTFLPLARNDMLPRRCRWVFSAKRCTGQLRLAGRSGKDQSRDGPHVPEVGLSQLHIGVLLV
jgi:hypothetical protein